MMTTVRKKITSDCHFKYTNGYFNFIFHSGEKKKKNKKNSLLFHIPKKKYKRVPLPVLFNF